MHNWWIASLEHFGLITHEEGEHLANNIKNSIHRDNYNDAVKSLEAILGEGKIDGLSVIQKLKNELEDTKTELRSLKTEVDKKVANKNKA